MAKNLANINAANTNSSDSFNANNNNNNSHSNTNSHLNTLSLPSTAALNIVNSHFSKVADPDQENKEIEEFKWY